MSSCISARAFSKSSLSYNPPGLPHRTPSKVRKPTCPQGIPVYVGSLEKSAHRNLFCLQVDRGLAVIYRSGLTGIQSHWGVRGPFRFLEYASCDFCKVLAVMQRRVPRVHTDGAGKGPCFPLTRKQLSFPWPRRNLLVSLGSVFS